MPKKPKYSALTLHRMGERVQGLACCGVAEFSGMGAINSVSDAEHMRRAPHYRDRRGYVLATTTSGSRHQTNRRGKYLTAAGFKVLARFKNPRTSNYITLYGAPTIRRGAADGVADPMIYTWQTWQPEF